MNCCRLSNRVGSLAIVCDQQLATRKVKRDYGGPLIRLHIGLEKAGDLIADLERALAVYADRIA